MSPVSNPSQDPLSAAKKACVELNPVALGSELDRFLRDGGSVESLFPLWDLALGAAPTEPLTRALLARSAPLSPPAGAPSLLPPLTLAAQRGSLVGCQLLLAAGADPNAWAPANQNAPARDASPLSAAVLNPQGPPQTLRILLDAGASPDAPEDHLFSPLHLACVIQNQDAIALLLAAGADPDRKTSGAMSCSDVVRSAASSHPGASLDNPRVTDILGMLAAASEAKALRSSLPPAPSPSRSRPLSF